MANDRIKLMVCLFSQIWNYRTGACEKLVPESVLSGWYSMLSPIVVNTVHLSTSHVELSAITVAPCGVSSRRRTCWCLVARISW